ncbi:coagulation factor 5/8 type domain-containing protein [Tunturibacter empetritectus]|uniref:Adenylyl cyclase n=1 Tax=Tunturiibacter lichenicola TaxID=2051959 RepID=A0A7W8N5V4_9BACT|nr:coagulation factor 5/8 type domain-containing protein [Edaphobacter lichenicola]MBB5344390.1 hypothetical protein [Edaphobacter lichenicola]
MRYRASKPIPAKPAFARLVGTLLLAAGALASSAVAQNTSDLGPNVYIFDPSMSTSQIQATVDSISNQQISNQFGTQRYALLFKPGVYGSAATPLNFTVGFYTEVAGLGASPDDVVINGSIDVYNQCFGSNNCIALDNFWRSLSNLAINVNTPNFGCYSGEFWAVSQAAPMRRVHITGNTTLMDYCSGPSYASGGFIADSETGSIVNGSQQQFYVRNSNIGSWSNGVWNQVFSGVAGAPAQSYPNPTYTTLPSTPVSRERPFLYSDSNGNYKVFIPALQKNSSGVSWSSGSTPGQSKSINNFFIATPSTNVEAINLALLFGKSLILTPGVYELKDSIRVLYPNTIVLGLGFATLVPQIGRPALTVTDVDGVRIAGLIVDAGPINSDVLVRLGSSRLRSLDNRFGINLFRDHSSNPSSLSDIFFRIGGVAAGSATTSLEINSNDVLVDDIWAWRADHGAGVGWIVNTADHGMIVNGDNVTATGLFVEHYQKEQVLWNGNGGETIFYQSELPYDPPSQSAWTDGTANGYPSYVVSNSATTHQAYGLGIYSFFNQGINIIEDNAMTVPNASGVAIHDVGTIWLNGSGQITHVINGQGATVNSSNADTLSPVVLYP